MTTTHSSSTEISNTVNKLRISIPAHPFHIVPVSPWPFVISYTLILLAISLSLYFTGYKTPFGLMPSYLVIISFITVLIIITLWLHDVTIEGTILGDHTVAVQRGLSIGFALFVVSEVFFFISIFWAYLHSSLAPAVELGAQWPPIGIAVINAFELPLLNTILLLSSGATVTYCHHAFINGDRKSGIIGLILTVVLAIVFTICQGIEYYNAGFTISDGVYGSAFYLATGTHGLHVIVGTIFLAVCLGRMINYHITTTHHVGLESAIVYYHFVDIVWLALFVLIYWWGS